MRKRMKWGASEKSLFVKIYSKGILKLKQMPTYLLLFTVETVKVCRHSRMYRSRLQHGNKSYIKLLFFIFKY